MLSQLSLSHFITTFSVSHLNSAKPISFSFFFKISGFKDEDDDSSAEISLTTDWVRSASLGGEWVGNADQPLRSNNSFGNRYGDRELIEHGGRSSLLPKQLQRLLLCHGVFVWGRGLELQRHRGLRRWESLMMGFRGLDFLWGLDLLFGFSVGFGISVWIFCGVMVVDDCGLMVVAGWVGWWVGFDGGGWWLDVDDFGFVLGLWEGSREEMEGNNKKCKKNEYFIEQMCRIDKLMSVFCKSERVK